MGTREGRVKTDDPLKEETEQQKKTSAPSRYSEDVYQNNHTAVWGSYWKEGRWGYACCHSFMKQSYCLGGGAKESTEKADIAKLDHLEKVHKQRLEEQNYRVPRVKTATVATARVVLVRVAA